MKRKKLLTYEDIKKLGYEHLIEKLENSICPECNQPVNINDFTNEFYLLQFNITGFCQPCTEKNMKKIEEFKNKGICPRCETPVNQLELMTEIQLSSYLKWGVCAKCQKMIIDKFSGSEETEN
jgi:endogenous inhibitor of DNA gyrase (YacG/DUF329 family)